MENFDDLMSEELKDVVNDVLEELTTNFSSEIKYNSLSPITEEMRDHILRKAGLVALPKYKKEMTTVYSVAKYLLLVVQNKETQEVVKKLLKDDLNVYNISVDFYDDVLPQVTFTNKESESVSLMYRFEDETFTKATFTLPSYGMGAGWDLNKEQLLAFLTKNTATSSSNTLNNPVKLDVGNLTITITPK